MSNARKRQRIIPLRTPIRIESFATHSRRPLYPTATFRASIARRELTDRAPRPTPVQTAYERQWRLQQFIKSRTRAKEMKAVDRKMQLAAAGSNGSRYNEKFTPGKSAIATGSRGATSGGLRPLGPTALFNAVLGLTRAAGKAQKTQRSHAQHDKQAQSDALSKVAKLTPAKSRPPERYLNKPKSSPTPQKTSTKPIKSPPSAAKPSEAKPFDSKATDTKQTLAKPTPTRQRLRARLRSRKNDRLPDGSLKVAERDL